MLTKKLMMSERPVFEPIKNALEEKENITKKHPINPDVSDIIGKISIRYYNSKIFRY